MFRSPPPRSGSSTSSWELAREYGFADYDGRRPDWGALAIDWGPLPPSLVKLFRTSWALQERWLATVLERTKQMSAKLPK